jgi:hypothetical protein
MLLKTTSHHHSPLCELHILSLEALHLLSDGIHVWPRTSSNCLMTSVGPFGTSVYSVDLLLTSVFSQSSDLVRLPMASSSLCPGGVLCNLRISGGPSMFVLCSPVSPGFFPLALVKTPGRLHLSSISRTKLYSIG